MSKRDAYREYTTSLLLYLFFPLMPLVLEFFFKGALTISSLSLSAAMYASSLGLSSINKDIFAFCFLIGIAFSAVFGATTVTASQVSYPFPPDYAAGTAIVAVFCMLAIEKYELHVVQKKPCLEFNK